MDIEFEVEQAGCESCAVRVRRALEPLLSVESITIDETRDLATVAATAETRVRRAAIDELLEDASVGAGHAYRVRPGSWRLKARAAPGSDARR